MKIIKRHTQPGKGFRKLSFYLKGFITYYTPDFLYRKRLNRILSTTPADQKAYIEERANYYNRMPHSAVNKEMIPVADFKYPFGQKKKFATYFFDLYRYLKYFDPSLKFSYLFGDVIEEPEYPTIVKSRPITDKSTNSVIMKLNQVRHYVFVNDTKSFREKKDMIVSRNAVTQKHRARFLEMYFEHPMCNAGQINKHHEFGKEMWIKEYMTIPEQLDYKFICCIEGNDVATNLKWVMSSNSLPVMPRPTYETWFMEGKLIPGYHYVEIKPDYSDLIEKMNYYIDHPEEAEAIIEHCHEYIKQFRNKKTEKLISLLVLQKYFRQTGQV